jgi:WD40 repeat protein
MAITIHPHKGYLNTDFHIHYNGTEKLNYSVYSSGNTSTKIISGSIVPHKPHILKISTPGAYDVRFDGGECIHLFVEDAYKFGGSRLKKAYVFDECPWLFVIMYDRTYFYNRKTEEEYIETISPDEIFEVSEDYILLSTIGQTEKTLFSLTDHKPIAEFQNIITFNTECIVYKESKDDETYICVYSILKHNRILKLQVDDYEVFGNKILFYYRNVFKKLSLIGEFAVSSLLVNHKGAPITFINQNIAVTYQDSINQTLLLYSIENGSIIKEIKLKGNLHSVNKKNLFNIYERRNAICRFNGYQVEIPGATVSVQYDDVEIYDCNWEIFYRIKSSRLIKAPYSQLSEDVSYTFDSCGRSTEVHYTQSFCEVYVHNTSIMIVSDDTTRVIIPDASCIELEEGKYDKRQFEQNGIIKNTVSGKSVLLKREFLSNEARFSHYESTGYTNLKSMGYKYISPKDNLAVEIKNNSVYLMTRKGPGMMLGTRILEKLFDYSNFKNVLLSEDGSKVMHRSGKNTTIVDIISGEKQNFANLSYIQHVNGIRPSFNIDKKRRVVLINPITGLQVSSETLSNHSFISPDKQNYADANLKAYEEWHNRIDDKVLSEDEHNELLSKYSFRTENSSKEYLIVKRNRELIVKENLAHFKRLENNAVDRSAEDWIKYFVDEENKFGNDYFLSFIVEKRGVAVIKRLIDDTELARINLGKPLWFLNYVSFSYDGKYVAIAGRYPDNTHDDYGKSLGGLFLCYDLVNKKILFKKTDSDAVWLTAFTKHGYLAAYSSNPITFILPKGAEEATLLRGYSFLTFSPDGQYFALSKKGYVRQDSNHNNWGHQKSTEVFICSINKTDEIICSYNDLDGNGIDSLASLVRHKESIASVSFSNDNKHLLMVGEDGVMIVRNLHLDNYAGE